MFLFEKKKKPQAIPDGFSAEDVRVESSTCTGETTIGFYSESERKLMYAELVRTQGDIDAFYEKYGISRK